MSFRSQTIERDFSGFPQLVVNETGGMVVISPKGKGDKPVRCQSEADVLTNFGTPSADYPFRKSGGGFQRSGYSPRDRSRQSGGNRPFRSDQGSSKYPTKRS